MNTTNYEDNNNLAVAESYYRYMLEKNFDAMASCLHENIHFISPRVEMSEKAPVVSAATGLGQILEEIDIRAKFAYHDQVMFAYDFMLPDPIGKLRAAVLMKFSDKLISRIELFFDPSPFHKG